MCRQRVLERNDDSDCILCMKLLYEPVTTPCGEYHSVCWWQQRIKSRMR